VSFAKLGASALQAAASRPLPRKFKVVSWVSFSRLGASALQASAPRRLWLKLKVVSWVSIAKLGASAVIASFPRFERSSFVVSSVILRSFIIVLPNIVNWRRGLKESLNSLSLRLRRLFAIIACFQNIDGDGAQSFLSQLQARGVHRVELIISGDHRAYKLHVKQFYLEYHGNVVTFIYKKWKGICRSSNTLLKYFRL
jgi:hypothetical protein